jgi:RNA polymerase sigma-70 factor, ECF subfamily
MKDYKNLEDKQLCSLAANQDDLAFNELIERNSEYMMAVACKFADTHDEAKDVFQKALIKSWKYLANFRNDCSFKTWIYKIIRNTVYDHSRWKSSRAEISLEGELTNGSSRWPQFMKFGNIDFITNNVKIYPADLQQDIFKTINASAVFEEAQVKQKTPAEQNQREEDLKHLKVFVEEALSKLSIEHRQCLLMFADGLTYEEMALAQKVPIGTIMSRLFYARKKAQYAFRHLKEYIN